MFNIVHNNFHKEQIDYNPYQALINFKTVLYDKFISMEQYRPTSSGCNSMENKVWK